jgi:hypothetical protein
MNRIIVLAFIAASALVVGCEEQKPTTGAGTTGGMAAAPVELKDSDLPTPADFDDQAEKDITSANYKAELDTLEKEITE